MPTLQKEGEAQGRSEPVHSDFPKRGSPSGLEVPAGPPIGPASDPFPAFSAGVEARLFQMDSAQAAQQEGLHTRLVELEQFRLADFEDFD